MIMTQKYLSLGKKARGGRIVDGKLFNVEMVNGIPVPLERPIYFSGPVDKIIIHWIGAYPGQSVYAPYYWWEDGTNGEGVQASAHFIVKNKDVLQALPLDEVGWHSGDIRVWNSIGIEVIPMDTKGEFSQVTIETLKELIAHIRTVYPKTKLERHFDGVQKKDCPRYYTPIVENGQERWEKLKSYLEDTKCA